MNLCTGIGRPMAFNRFPSRDPRTVARDIPGIFDAIFPQLTSGVVAYFNKRTVTFEECEALPDDLVKASTLSHAMLFEIAFARGEQLLNGMTDADWNDCLQVAVKRQRRHFDAHLPDALLDADKTVADWVGKNLDTMLTHLQSNLEGSVLVASPQIPGYQWIASGVGDFSLGTNLIEVKCTNRHFGSADYRQILMYWLLSYASAIERDSPEWRNGILLNPRLNYVLEISFNEIIEVTGAGKSKIEILELFSSIVGDYGRRSLTSLRL